MAPSLSRLRLSPHFTALQRFHALDGAEKRKQPHVTLELASATACTDVLHICHHLDLEAEILPEKNGVQRVVVRRGTGGNPDCSDAEDVADEVTAAGPMVVEADSDAGVPPGRVVVGPSPAARPADPPPTLPKPLA